MGVLFIPRPMMLLVVAFLCLINLYITPTLAALNHDEPTAYDFLKKYNFPKGLLPVGVTGYELNNSTGKFSAFLKGTCSFSLEGSYQLRYQSTITGYISTNKITNLQGVSVKILLFWVNIIEVLRVGDELQFSVGIASANFPLDNFEERPQCGCGLNCHSVNYYDDDVKISKKLRNPFVDFS